MIAELAAKGAGPPLLSPEGLRGLSGSTPTPTTLAGVSGYAFQRQGYDFTVAAPIGTEDASWIAVATPLVPGTTGDRYFRADPDGVIYYRVKAPFAVDPGGPVPSDARRVGE